MNQTVNDELKSLLELIKFKGYRRNDCVLYAKYGYYKPECTISELVWGFCRNPCYARHLVRELFATIPDYGDMLSKANRNISTATICPTFDLAMARICKKDGERCHMAFSTEGTSQFDAHLLTGLLDVQTCNATDDDGELWHGLLIPSQENWMETRVDNIKVTFYSTADPTQVLWEHTFSGKKSLTKRIKRRNDVVVFQPFKHPLPLLDLDIRIATQITFKQSARDATSEPKVLQLFGICSNEYCAWLSESALEIKLCKNKVARIDGNVRNISFS